MDCPDTCALNVTIEDQTIKKITGADGHPDTGGFICSKVSRFHRRVYHEDRLLQPMVRTGPKGSGQFEPISWDEACQTIVTRFNQIRQTHGGEAILPYHYGGSNGILSEEYLDSLLFAELGASQLDKTICAAPSTAAQRGMYGGMQAVPFRDFAKARCILIWGANTRGSNLHLTPYLKAAKKNGATIISIDPMQRFTKTEVDLNLGVRPGTDLVLALAMIHIWQENNQLNEAFMDRWTLNREPLLKAAREWSPQKASAVCGVPEKDILFTAETYASEELALIRCGWGLERNSNGGQATAAILAMPALLGKFGKVGNGFAHSNSSSSTFNRDAVLGPISQNTRTLNMSQLPELLKDCNNPPVKGLFVYNSNPAATSPDQNGVLEGLAREDLFTVVFEQVMTDTCAYADIILPATTFLEQYEIRKAYGSYVIGGAKPVIPPRGLAKSNLEVFAMLGRAFGFKNLPFQWDTSQHFDKICAQLNIMGKHVQGETLKNGGVVAYEEEDGPPIQFVNLFPTNNKVNLCPPALGAKAYEYIDLEQARFPLAFVSPASEKLITSTLGEFNLDKLQVMLNPRDAEQRGLEDNAPVRVFNHLGEVHCHLKITSKLAAGSALMPKGAWRKSSINGKTSTALCPTNVEVTAGGACFGDARVEIELLPGFSS